ncbi:putative DNA binding domain-containing protein [Candidatus Bipolaricaulota bacterium]|nr:putative DNA binding domain-containing protein [Candidatus Bipolaricaulota bacterium]TFH11754.1 MAG: winged helix-turn-helix transcriptional regulator [Candidatus Atribacteria bacterium]
MDILDLLRRSEGKTLEFKRDLSSPKGVLHTLVAFANTAGGILLIGVEDKSHNVRGVTNPLDLEEKLANLISDSISPRLLPEVEILSWRQSQLLGIQIYPSPNRPHFIKKEGLERGAYVRVDSTNRRADKELIEGMQRFAQGETYDEQAMPDLNSEDIDFRAASELFAPERILKPKDLETLRLITPHQGRKVPTVGGFLLFGRNRERYFPDVWIQAGRFQGTNKTHIADQSQIKLHLPAAVDAAVEFVNKHTLHGVEIGAVRRVEQWNLPPAAVREAIINALAHADYAERGAPTRISIFDDRLEIENPGLLLFGLTVDDLRQGISKLRNRVIGRVFHELGLVEQWGSGIQRIVTTCREAGLDEPRFEELGTRFRVTLYTTKRHSPTADSVDLTILEMMNAEHGLSTQEIATAIGLTPRATRTRLSKLVNRGLVREIGTSPQDPRRRYFSTG